MRQIDLSPSISRHPRKRGPCSESHKNWGPCFTSPKNSEGPVKIFLPVTTCSYPSPTRAEPTSRGRPESIESDLERPCGLLAACRVLPPALLHRLIVLAGEAGQRLDKARPTSARSKLDAAAAVKDAPRRPRPEKAAAAKAASEAKLARAGVPLHCRRRREAGWCGATRGEAVAGRGRGVRYDR